MVELQTQACYDILNLYAVWMMAYLELIYERRIRDERQISDTTCGKIRNKEMQYIFSPDMKFKTWRRLWIALAETEHELGLPITQEQIDELKVTRMILTMRMPRDERKK